VGFILSGDDGGCQKFIKKDRIKRDNPETKIQNSRKKNKREERKKGEENRRESSRPRREVQEGVCVYMKRTPEQETPKNTTQNESKVRGGGEPKRDKLFRGPMRKG